MAEAIRTKYNEIIDSDSETDYGIVISSGYRNPKKNDTLRDAVATSKHQWGRALDLIPGRLPPNTTEGEALDDILEAVERTYPGHNYYRGDGHVHVAER